MALLIDHLWQSVLFFVLVGGLAALTRRNSAALHLWLWRIAALKFLLPFALLFALGGWLGFPVRHSAIPPPVVMTEAFNAMTPWFAPAQTLWVSRFLEITAAVLALTACSAWWIGRQLRRARRGGQSADDPTPPLGFFTTTALAGTALCAIVAPMIAGALQDRLRRQAALEVDTHQLRMAAISLSETPWRFGMRAEIAANTSGVVIRYINLQDLVALVYGIGEFEVFGGALPWLESPHYEVRVTGPVQAPALFDPYSLRQPVTDYLSREFGVAIRVNGSCQEPCLNQESFAVERVPWKILSHGHPARP